jgi:hypothetical protein
MAAEIGPGNRGFAANERAITARARTQLSEELLSG